MDFSHSHAPVWECIRRLSQKKSSWRITVSDKDNETNLLRFNVLQKITYHYSAGRYASQFFYEIKENKKLFGVKCPSCGKVYVPPRIVCGECYEEMNEWVEVGPQGTVMGCTSVKHSFPDPLTGKERKTPYGFGLIRLDGCDTGWFYFLEESDYEKMKAGMRVEVVFAEECTGDLTDILYFRTVNPIVAKVEGATDPRRQW